MIKVLLVVPVLALTNKDASKWIVLIWCKKKKLWKRRSPAKTEDEKKTDVAGMKMILQVALHQKMMKKSTCV